MLLSVSFCFIWSSFQLDKIWPDIHLYLFKILIRKLDCSSPVGFDAFDRVSMLDLEKKRVS